MTKDSFLEVCTIGNRLCNDLMSLESVIFHYHCTKNDVTEVEKCMYVTRTTNEDWKTIFSTSKERSLINPFSEISHWMKIKKKQIDNDYLDAFYIFDKIRIIIIIIYLYLRYFWWILYFRNYFISVWHLASKIFLNYVLGILLKSCYFKNNTR